MKIPEKILVVLNDTKWHDSMHKTTMKLSGKYGSDFAILHVFPESEKDNHEFRDEITEFHSSISNSKIRIIEQELEFGDVDKIILEKDSSLKPDLILIDGGENHTNVEAFILKIITEAKANIWTVERTHSTNMNKIICPIDFSDTSIEALKEALSLAKEFGSQLAVLTVNDSTDSTSVFMNETLEDANKESIKDGENNIKSMLKDLDTEGINPEIKVSLGDPAEEIDKEIIEWEADLLVIGTHGRSGIQKKIMGSVAEKVVKKVPCSSLIIKSKMLSDE